MSYLPVVAGVAVVNMLAIASPGPAFFLVSRAAAGRSRRQGVATGLGVTLAASLWALAAIFGVGMLMTRFTTLYGLVQLAGGAYLIWLGLSAWSASQQTGEAAPAVPAPASPWRALLTGVSLTLTNPKVVIYFTSIFVALFPGDTPLWVRLVVLAIVLVEEFAWWVLVAYVFSHARVQAAYQRFRGVLDRVLGVAFIAFGARIVALARL
ncbi:LysE family transporter [Acidihalobacter prosperus]|uniref:Threonine efflux protein n=1 Tax=Acidihalobacter prosperus TaxID=160660 RepID=A0A1A6C0T5_9GAMM|nr:LysE family transporter [Acidihalobacter prosperus]OBS08170.1 Threonine efflux protein [Acidihalobacter prosperus]